LVSTGENIDATCAGDRLPENGTAGRWTSGAGIGRVSSASNGDGAGAAVVGTTSG